MNIVIGATRSECDQLQYSGSLLHVCSVQLQLHIKLDIT